MLRTIRLRCSFLIKSFHVLNQEQILLFLPSTLRKKTVGSEVGVWCERRVSVAGAPHARPLIGCVLTLTHGTLRTSWNTHSPRPAGVSTAARTPAC